MDKKIIIIAVCIGTGCSTVAVVAGAVILFRHWRRRQRVFSVAEGSISLKHYICMCVRLTSRTSIQKTGLMGSCLTLQMRILVLHMLGSSSSIFDNVYHPLRNLCQHKDISFLYELIRHKYIP